MNLRLFQRQVSKMSVWSLNEHAAAATLTRTDLDRSESETCITDKDCKKVARNMQ